MAQIPFETIEQWGTPRIERYVPRVTRIGDPALTIHMLPKGELAFLSETQFVLFDGTQWKPIPELYRPTRVEVNTGEMPLVGYDGGIRRLTPNQYGNFDYEQISGPRMTPESPVAMRFAASARGYTFGSHGQYLRIIAPDGTETQQRLESWVSTLFSIGDEIYLTGGSSALINRWDWETQRIVDCQEVLEHSEYAWINDVKKREAGGVWMINGQKRIIGFDGEKTWFWPGNSEIAEREALIQCFTEVGPDELAIGTRNMGALVFDRDGKVVQQINKSLGLDDVSIIGIGIDNQQGLWLSTKRSVSRVSLSPNTLVFDERHGLNEPIIAIEVCHDRLYLATQSGLYVNNPEARAISESFVLQHEISGISDIMAHGDYLFVAATEWLVIDKNDTKHRISSEGTRNLWQPSADPNLVISGNYRGVLASRYSDGKWGEAEYLQGPRREIYNLAETDDGVILGSLGGPDYAKIVLEDDGGRVEIRPIPTDMQGKWSTLASVEGKIYINSVPSMVWDSQKDTFLPGAKIGYYLGDPPYGFDQVFASSNENTWICVNARSGKTVFRPNREVVGNISSINDGLETRASCIAYDESGRAWIGGTFGLMLSLTPQAPIPELQAGPSIHRLLSLRDNAELPIVGGKDGVLRLKPEQNSLRIETEFPNFFASNQNQQQIFIEGLDQNWPEFSAIAFREVTNIPPGSYVLSIVSRNNFGQQAAYSLPIHIATPLHLRPIAFVLYAIIAALSVAFIVYFYSRQQIRRSKRLQQLVAERTLEIASKNTELEQQAIRLEKQNEELAEKTEELTATTETLTATLSQLQEMQDQLVATARTAGKAEIAINVLHNVGNVLNSLNVSVNVLSQRTQDSHATKLTRIAELIEKNQANIAEFMSSDPRGKNVPTYLIQLSKTLEKEMATTLQELGVMNDDIDHIKSVIAAQQTHAKSECVIDDVRIRELCKSALDIIGDERRKTQIEVVNEVPEDLVVKNDKHRLLDITLNLITNALDAIDEQQPELGILTLKATPLPSGETIEFTVTDNGSGIEPAIQDKLFRHGFTTKDKGHGFGLHSCANAAKVLGGVLTLNSPGKGLGATATLLLPVEHAQLAANSSHR